MDQFIASHVGPIDSSGIRRVFDLGASLSDPINLSIGQPDFPVPDPIKRAIVQAVQDNRNGYTVTAGLPQLRERIARRFAAMLEAGLWDEARAARADPRYDPRLPVLKAVGYRQLFAAIEGRCGEAEAVERAIIATRQYAKRQLTWLRRDAEVHWLDSAAADLETRAGRLLSEWASQGGSAA